MMKTTAMEIATGSDRSCFHSSVPEILDAIDSAYFWIDSTQVPFSTLDRMFSQTTMYASPISTGRFVNMLRARNSAEYAATPTSDPTSRPIATLTDEAISPTMYMGRHT